MSDNKDAVSITVPFAFKGQHYQGVSALNGVGLELVDAPCGSDRKMVSFLNCSNAPKGIFFDCVSAIVADEPAIHGYLRLKPNA